MSPVQKFTDLECWKSARKTTNMMYDLFSELRDFAFRDQILRAAISIMNNVAE
jgi:four helix bundle protein